MREPQLKPSDVRPVPRTGAIPASKRRMDVVLSLAGLALLWPLFLLVAILIKFDSRGPVFFRQRRIGKNGVPFDMYKFRSMVADAERRRQSLQQYNEASGPVFKMNDDPRTTRVGRWLRKYSLDELPQLWNVCKGEMSLVGPRPPLPEEVAKYTEHQLRRLETVPGLTGLWQVSERRHRLPFEEWVRLDLHYIRHWSLKLDLMILFRTVRVIIRGKGV